MDECTSNENAVDDKEILLFFSFHVILNQCNFTNGYYFSGLWFLKSLETAIAHSFTRNITDIWWP